MRLRSTGLGKTELEAEIVDTKRVGDLVLFYVDVVKPVKWHTRMGFQEKDLRKLALAVLKPRNLRYIILALLFPKRKVGRTGNF